MSGAAGLTGRRRFLFATGAGAHIITPKHKTFGAGWNSRPAVTFAQTEPATPGRRRGGSGARPEPTVRVWMGEGCPHGCCLRSFLSSSRGAARSSPCLDCTHGVYESTARSALVADNADQ